VRNAHRAIGRSGGATATGLRRLLITQSIEAFAAGGQRMTVAEIARYAQLTRAATRRYLLTLAANGYAVFDGKRFQLSSRVLRLGHAYISSVPLPQIAQPIVEELGHRTDESIALGVLEGRIAHHRVLRSAAYLGIFTRRNASACALDSDRPHSVG
jgi:IclR family pca regulon transcriptional regulator